MFSIEFIARISANIHKTIVSLVALAGLCFVGIGSALAAVPTPWQLGLPDPVSPIAEEQYFFHNVVLMPVITVVTLFVLGLLIYVCYRFSEKRNPVPSKTTHHTWLEVLWTTAPILILLVIFIPSIRLHYQLETIPESDMTLKITGNQWYWTYEYPDEGVVFDSNMLSRDELAPNQQHLYRMLTDNIVVLPVNRTIRLQFTASDVLHNWAISDIGVRMDTVPGRLNEAWTRVTKVGDYYGFCSELCGVNHAFMPIAIKVVEDAEYQEWLKRAKVEFAADAGDVIEQAPIKQEVALTFDNTSVSLLK